MKVSVKIAQGSYEVSIGRVLLVIHMGGCQNYGPFLGYLYIIRYRLFMVFGQPPTWFSQKASKANMYAEKQVSRAAVKQGKQASTQNRSKRVNQESE